MNGKRAGLDGFFPGGHHGGERLVWFPKSQISECKAPGWLIQAKAQDLRDSLTNQRGVAFEMRIGEHTIFPQ